MVSFFIPKVQLYLNKSMIMQGSILFISGQEIVIIFVVFLLLFGAKSVPDLAKGLGKGMREFKKATDDIKKKFQKTLTT